MRIIGVDPAHVTLISTQEDITQKDIAEFVQTLPKAKKRKVGKIIQENNGANKFLAKACAANRVVHQNNLFPGNVLFVGDTPFQDVLSSRLIRYRTNL